MHYEDKMIEKIFKKEEKIHILRDENSLKRNLERLIPFHNANMTEIKKIIEHEMAHYYTAKSRGCSVTYAIKNIRRFLFGIQIKPKFAGSVGYFSEKISASDIKRIAFAPDNPSKADYKAVFRAYWQKGIL